ncbi:Glutathione import ATP-binding protein GsiA [bioreactor metagenome]|uniref:Glutathione import ATP-binding protein GsiA n=1 Tax=bioreactor metagenome TaxID=1076179 RepID=A0A644UD67_9ZZZZ|nr:ABC transporter ATP-binding protein [Lentimicrobium sp.]MEA5111904.1 ABC transporter ATP-binding protein [Lentimicrobium sp.]
MPETVLHVNDLSIAFHGREGWQQAVRQVSISLKRGETLGIVGESGSGKSVTSLAVMHLLPAGISRINNGSIVFNGKSGEVIEIHNLGEKEMLQVRGGKIAMIFQEPMTSLNPVMRCGRQLTEAVRMHLGYDQKKARDYVLSLFSEVMLPDPERAYRAYPHQLSGGQKQRVMIAMAIACKPEILIADEPTTALDMTVQKAILRLLKTLQQKYNMSMIFISHDLGVISEIAGSVAVMREGQIVEYGRVSEIFSNPEHPYTRGLIACRPPLNIRLRRLPVVSDYTETKEGIKKVRHYFSAAITAEERRLTHLKLYENDPLLKVENLSVHYPLSKPFFKKERSWFKAVDDVSFSVYRGETLGLAGESGCGKTTLGRALLRLLEPTSGTITFKETNIAALSRKELRMTRKNMQIIFQDPYSSLNPRITAGEAIIEPLLVHKIISNQKAGMPQVKDLLERVGLKPEHYNRYPHQFSGGQRQRICIARALALNPEFIICDESVSALDVSVQAQVLNLLNDLKKDYGFTFIFISHDLSVVRFMSDRIMVMKEGKLIESGEADALCEKPQKDYTRELIAAIPGNAFNPAP